MRSRRNGWRRAIRCSAVALVLAPALVVGGVAAPAQADVISPGAWTDFLAAHPELTETEAGQLAVGECTATAAICPEEALLAGGFLVGYVGATKVLHWAFGSGGDDRSFLSSSAPGWSWQTSGGYSAPPTPGPSSGFLANLVRTDASTYANGLTSTWWCMTTTGSVGDPVSGGAINSVASGSGMSAQVACGGATPLVYRVQWVGAHTLFATAPVIQRWTYDPPKPWSVSVHVRCLNTDGTTFEVSGGVVSVASSAGGTATPDLTLPSCTAVTPTAAPQVVYLTGGRASDDPDGIL
ncbi:MAG: hypothetical protein JWP11_3800, partial [Frankiales bacterium]|nr:hypothetical protein [Frankiales bacterium]